MYYPYLRAKQFELLALRDWCEKGSHLDTITPILEPVKAPLKALGVAAQTMLEKGMRFAVIVNSTEGDYKYNSYNLLEELPQLAENIGKWQPAYKVKDDAAKIIADIKANDFNDVLIFCDGSSNAVIEELIELDAVSTVVTSLRQRKLRNFITNKGKQIVQLEEAFKAKSPNEAYREQLTEFFSESCFAYEEELYDGFSDYVTLPAAFQEGGMLPSVLAIHLTFERDEQIFIHHSLSSQEAKVKLIQNKFQEAVTDVKIFYESQGLPRTEAVTEMIDMLTSSHYPGLGYLKKLSILNHFEIIENILNR